MYVKVQYPYELYVIRYRLLALDRITYTCNGNMEIMVTGNNFQSALSGTIAIFSECNNKIDGYTI